MCMYVMQTYLAQMPTLPDSKCDANVQRAYVCRAPYKLTPGRLAGRLPVEQRCAPRPVACVIYPSPRPRPRRRM